MLCHVAHNGKLLKDWPLLASKPLKKSQLGLSSRQEVSTYCSIIFILDSISGRQTVRLEQKWCCDVDVKDARLHGGVVGVGEHADHLGEGDRNAISCKAIST